MVPLFGSTSAFSQLQSALNTIWEVPPQAHAGLWAMVRARFLAFAAVLGTGFLLSVSLVLSAAVAAFGRYGWGSVPGIDHMFELADLLGSYLGSSELGAAYGAAGWVILILAWVYYSAQILLFGAEFTHAYQRVSPPHTPLPSGERAG